MSASNTSRWCDFIGGWRRLAGAKQRIIVKEAVLGKTIENGHPGHVFHGNRSERAPPEFDNGEEMASISRNRCTTCQIVWWEDELHKACDAKRDCCPQCHAQDHQHIVCEVAWLPIPRAAWDAWFAVAGCK